LDNKKHLDQITKLHERTKKTQLIHALYSKKILKYKNRWSWYENKNFRFVNDRSVLQTGNTFKITKSSLPGLYTNVNKANLFVIGFKKSFQM